MKNGLIIEKSELGKKDRWEEIYQGQLGEIHWDVGTPSNEIIELVKNMMPCSALDIGCGTGTEAIYLARNGFRVSAIDISKTAIQTAKDKAKRENVSTEFITGDVLNLPFADNDFGFVNDRGCFHVIEPKDREKFVSEINRVLKPAGKYLMMCFSDKEPEAEKGPYRISKREIKETFSSYFNIIKIKPIKLYGKGIQHEGYSCLMDKK